MVKSRGGSAAVSLTPWCQPVTILDSLSPEVGGRDETRRSVRMCSPLTTSRHVRFVPSFCGVARVEVVRIDGVTHVVGAEPRSALPARTFRNEVSIPGAKTIAIELLAQVVANTGAVFALVLTVAALASAPFGLPISRRFIRARDNGRDVVSSRAALPTVPIVNSVSRTGVANSRTIAGRRLRGGNESPCHDCNSIFA